MTTIRDELHFLASNFRALSTSAFTLHGQRYEVEERSEARVAEGLLSTRALERLAEVLYSSLHCRLSVEAWASSAYRDPAFDRAFLQRLSNANGGTGTWQSGWLVRGIEGDGRVLAERFGVRFEVVASQVRTSGPSPSIAGPVAVRVPKEYRNLVAGFYMALGDADDTMKSEETTRVYWNLRASGAEELVACLTGLLNADGVPFWLKVARSPENYHRSDAAVLYVHRDQYAHAEPAIARAYNGLRQHMRSGVSAFAKFLAPGLAVGEDPGEGVSFGQHRSGIVAQALAGCKGTPARSVDDILDVFEGAGFNPDALHLARGSGSSYRPLAERR